MPSFVITNPPQVNDLNQFRAVLASNWDLARVARYAVQIRRQNQSGITNQLDAHLVYLCEAAEMPGRALNVDEVRYYGPVFKMPFQSAYTDMNLTFICRDRMLEKEYFDVWMEQINPKSSYNFAYRDTYECEIDIYQFSDVNSSGLQATYKATCRHAYPIFVNPLPLNWAEDNFHRLQITFAFTDWYTPRENINSGNFALTSNTTMRIGGTVLGRGT